MSVITTVAVSRAACRIARSSLSTSFIISSNKSKLGSGSAINVDAHFESRTRALINDCVFLSDVLSDTLNGILKRKQNNKALHEEVLHEEVLHEEVTCSIHDIIRT